MACGHLLTLRKKIIARIEQKKYVSKKRKRECGQELLETCSLSTRPAMTENFVKSSRVKSASSYSAYAFQPLHCYTLDYSCF